MKNEVIQSRHREERIKWPVIKCQTVQGTKVKTGRIECVENCRRSEILYYLQANKLIWCNFIDGCRRQEFHGSETKKLSLTAQ